MRPRVELGRTLDHADSALIPNNGELAVAIFGAQLRSGCASRCLRATPTRGLTPGLQAMASMQSVLFGNGGYRLDDLADFLGGADLKLSAAKALSLTLDLSLRSRYQALEGLVSKGGWFVPSLFWKNKRNSASGTNAVAKNTIPPY